MGLVAADAAADNDGDDDDGDLVPMECTYEVIFFRSSECQCCIAY